YSRRCCVASICSTWKSPKAKPPSSPRPPHATIESSMLASKWSWPCAGGPATYLIAEGKGRRSLTYSRLRSRQRLGPRRPPRLIPAPKRRRVSNRSKCAQLGSLLLLREVRVLAHRGDLCVESLQAGRISRRVNIPLEIGGQVLGRVALDLDDLFV